MVLTDRQIKEYVKKDILKIENFSEKSVQPASYDMRIGDEVFTSTAREIINLTRNDGHFTIEPSAVALIGTYEYLEVPKNIVGRPGLRSSLTRQGLFASIGIQADPGFEGRFFINLLNLTSHSIPLDRLDPFLSIEFSELESDVDESYKGPYQGKRHITSEDIKPLLAYEGLNLAQVHKGFTDLKQDIKAVASLGERFDKLIVDHRKETEKIMRHNTRLINEIKKLVEYISSQQTTSTVVLRSVDREQAMKEIEGLFKKGKMLYYSDIAEQLGLDLELVVDICNELENKGIIGMLEQ
jgi:dCTP deaminase